MKNTGAKRLIAFLTACALLLAAAPLAVSASSADTKVFRVRTPRELSDALWSNSSAETVVVRLESDIVAEPDSGNQIIWDVGYYTRNAILDLNGHVLDLNHVQFRVWIYSDALITLTDSAGGGRIKSDTTDDSITFISNTIMGDHPFSVFINGVTFENDKTMGRAFYVFGDNGKKQSVHIQDGTFINYGSAFNYTEVEELNIRKMIRRSTSGSVNFIQDSITVGEAVEDGFEVVYYRYEYPDYIETVAAATDELHTVEVYEGYDAVVRPTFAEALYSVEFDANGGSGSMETVKRYSGYAFAFPDCAFAAPGGKRFDHWLATGREFAPGEIIFVTYNFSVAAVWADGLKGDFNKNGKIEVDDALSALRIAAKLAEETDEAIGIGDVDGDGHVTVSDALAILRVAAKLADQTSLG